VARLFVVLGIVFLALGLLWPLLGRIGLGHLPGDVAFRRGHVTFYFPLATSLLLSLALSVLLTLIALLVGRR
jgi:hypothetical protein